MIIIGAGLAGLLAGNMLRHRMPTIYETQKELPNNHSAVLRFKSSAVGDVLNIPFRKVTLVKAHAEWKNKVADTLAYAKKNTGEYRSDRSIIAGETIAERWVAPPNLIAQMAAGLNIHFGRAMNNFPQGSNRPTVSTMPMPSLMKALDYPDRPDFSYRRGLNIRATIKDCDAYVSLLVPMPLVPFSRISITGDEMIIEASNEELKKNEENYAQMCVGAAAGLLGIPESEIYDIRTSEQSYAKITPIDDATRKNFLFWVTDRFNIFSLGRFATWRPGLLMDDLVDDLRKIDSWITQGHYSIARHR